MRSSIAVAVIFLLAFVSANLTAQHSRTPVTAETIINDTELSALLNNSYLASHDPDRFNWTVFTLIVRSIDRSLQYRTPSGQTNDVEWEKWPDNQATFIFDPNPDCHKPQWEVRGAPSPDPARFRFQRKNLATPATSSSSAHIVQPQEPEWNCAPADAVTCDQVKRDMPSFNFIVKHELYYEGGLAKAYINNVDGHPLVFDKDSLEVKAEWELLGAETLPDFPNYHWNRDNDGKLYRLVGLHVMTRALPNWTWATFEWVGNPRRCQENGCRDSFGDTFHHITPSECKTGKCPDRDLDAISPGLNGLFARYGISPEWRYYRLNGSQTEFGKSEPLGNSEIEVNNMRQASCIACHNEARVASAGAAVPDYARLSWSFISDGVLGKPGIIQEQGTPISFLWSPVIHAKPEAICPHTQ